MKFTLPPLPFAQNALEPHLSREQIFYHYEHHHRGYLEKLDAALTGDQRSLSLEALMSTSKGRVYNLAAQVWNHNFLWQSLSPKKTAPRDTPLADLLQSSFGGRDGFNDRFTRVAAEHFGSGWAWLVYDPGLDRLAITSTDDAKNPLDGNAVPLLTLDVWEHAYYLDYKDDRKSYIAKFLDHLINWDFANGNLAAYTQAAPRKRGRG
jgi:Fe-Mn family superoxide dismutase